MYIRDLQDDDFEIALKVSIFTILHNLPLMWAAEIIHFSIPDF